MKHHQVNEIEAIQGSKRDQRGLRLALIALPFLISLPVVLTNEVSAGESLRYLLWSAGWWATGLGLTAFLPEIRTRMTAASFGGLLGVAAQLVAWAIATWGHSSLALPALLITSLIGIVISTRTRTHLIEMFSGSLRQPSRTAWQPIPTYALVAWSLFSLWLLAQAQAFFRDNSFSPHRAAAMQDLFWHLGIAGQLKHHIIPPVSESDTGAYLNYHWLSDAFMAAGSLGAHVPTVMATERLWLIPTLLLASSLMVVVTREVTGTYLSVIPALIVISVSTTTPILPWQGLGPSATFVLQSPSQVFGIPMMLFALAHITRIWRRGVLSWTAALGLVAVFVLCAGSKSSIIPVFIGGVTVTLLASRIMSPRRRHDMWMTGAKIWLCAVIAELIALPLFAGGSAGSQIRLVGHLRHWGVMDQLTGHPHGVGHGPFVPPGVTFITALVIAVLVILLVASYGVGFLAMTLGGTVWRNDPLPAFLAFSVLSSIVAFCLIDHTGESESYFPMGAMPLLAILGGWGFSRLWAGAPQTQNRARAVRVGGALAVAITAIVQWMPHALPAHATLWLWLGVPVLIWAMAAVLGWCAARHGHAVIVATALVGVSTLWPAWHALRATVPDLTRPAPKASSSSVYANEQDGLRWIRDHTPSNALVATNVHCHDVTRHPHCDSSAYWTNGFAERRFFIGSWGYTDDAQRNAGVSGYSAIQQDYPDHAAFALNEAMFYSPSADVARQLRDKGVTWLFADARVAPTSPKIGTFAHLVETWGNVKVYHLAR